MNQDASFLTGKTIVAYVRVSDEDSDPERQRTTIRKWAEKYGLTISMWFEDTEGRNPRDESEKRVRFQQMMRLIENGGIHAVVVDSIERLGFKDQHEFGFFIHNFRTHGCIGWSTVDGNLSAVDPGTIFQNTAKTIGSTLEQANIARRNLGEKAILARMGEYQGGYPAFGFDVVCFDKDNEVWRVVYDGGHHRRVKVMVDGTRQRYDGKGNFPSRDNGQKLMVRPSIEFAHRLDAVKRMFEWVQDEGLSPAQVATRLNIEGIAPQVGEAWNKVVVKALLQNPVFLGYPTFNKRGQGKYAEWTDGAPQPTSVVPGTVRPKKGRRRERKDWIAPAQPQFPAIIEKKLFDEVQAKLKASSEKHGKTRTRRVASFWLRGLLFCGKCRKPMRAWNEPGWRTYFCGTYGTYGKHNPTGCRCHRVRAEVIEGIVMEYLEETAKKVAVLHALQQKGRIPSAILDALKSAEDRHDEAWKRMVTFVLDCLEDGVQEVEILGQVIVVEKYGDEIRLPEGFSKFDLCDHFSRTKQGEIERAIAQKEQQFDFLFQEFRVLKSQMAKDRVNEDMVRVEAEIKELNEQLAPLAQEVRDNWRETIRMLSALETCRRVMKEGNDRRKAEAVTSVISEVVCHFRYSDIKATNQPKSFLERVEITSTEGEPWECFPEGNTPGRD
jgi:DNA invertase Pin-like site-specific DNA recombinase